jgi:heme/copper-type cytochrome/quinol oxidase subunit 3
VHDGAFAAILTLLLGTAFVIAAVFEIKRLADQPSETDHH